MYIEEEIKLTARQEWLYNYLVNKTFVDKKIVTIEEIINDYNYYNDMRDDFERYVFNDKAHDKCIAVRNDIDILNLTFSKEHIIYIKGNYTYKIATTREEVKEMLKRIYYRVAFTKLKKASKLVAKMKRDSLMQLVDNETLEPLEEAVTKFISVFESDNDNIDKAKKEAQ